MSIILNYKAENVKRIHAVEMPLGPGLTVVGGNNGNGKTSVLDSILYALCGEAAICDKPLREGQPDGFVEIKTDDYIIRREWKRRDDDQVTTRLVLRDKEGLVISRKQQSILNELFAGKQPDVNAFLRMAPAAKAATLRQLIGIDTTELDAQRENLYRTRRDANSTARDLEAAVSELTYFDDAPKEEVSLSELIEKLNMAHRRNLEVQEMVEMPKRLLVSVDHKKAEVQRLFDSYKAAKADYDRLVADLEKATSEAKGAPDHYIEVAPIQAQMTSIGAINSKVQSNARWSAAHKRSNEARDYAESLTVCINQLDAEKLKLLQSAKFPIPGLGIEGDQILFDALPLEQASSAEQLRVGLSIYLALNPKLKFVPIFEGSLFDDESLSIIAEMAQAAGAQVIMERVGEGSECSIIIEDGSIKERE
jgi:DNA repair exonuclease SbcCD ATPase subunit